MVVACSFMGRSVWLSRQFSGAPQGVLLSAVFLLNIEWRAICIGALNRERECREFFETVKADLETEMVIILLGDFTAPMHPRIQ